MLDAVRGELNYTSSRVLYDALSSTATVVMLRRHAMAPAINGVQDEDAYVSQIMGRISAKALGKALFVESLSGKVSCDAMGKRKRGHRARTLRTHLANARKSAAELVTEET
jgi:hypothetical protein